jgi:hypothetical protein
MEYFTIERPEICLNYIVNQKADACGVQSIKNGYMYGGNFWAISCQYAIDLQTLPIGDRHNKSMYWDGENWFKTNRPRYNEDRFINLHDPQKGLYRFEIHPTEYSDYLHRWNISS